MITYTTQTGAAVTINVDGSIVVMAQGKEHKFNATARHVKGGCIDFGYAKITVPAGLLGAAKALLSNNDAAVLAAAEVYAANDFSAKMDRRMYAHNSDC